MSAPSPEPRQVPAYVALVRIGAVIGMSATIAFGIFLIIGGIWLAGIVSALLATPFFVIMRLSERLAGDGEPPEE